MKKYFPLIEFTINHDFFNDGKCRDIELMIGHDETRLKNNYDILLKKTAPWKYVFYVGRDVTFEEVLTLLEKDLAEEPRMIEFLLVVRNRSFFSYTRNAELLGSGRLADLSIPLGDSADEMVFTISDNPVFCSDAAFIERINRKYPSAIACATLQLTGGVQGQLFQWATALRPLQVTFSFEAKSAYWSYYLISRNAIKPELFVTEAHQQINFTDINWVMMDSGNEAGFSQSVEAVKLSEKYPYWVQLWEKHFNGQCLLANRLSFPDPANPASFSHDEQMRDIISIYQYF